MFLHVHVWMHVCLTAACTESATAGAEPPSTHVYHGVEGLPRGSACVPCALRTIGTLEFLKRGLEFLNCVDIYIYIYYIYIYII